MSANAAELSCGCKKTEEEAVDVRNNPSENLALMREIYVQTQNWARHNETLIVATNTVLLGAVAAISSSFFKNSGTRDSDIFLLPVAVALIGILITAFLSFQYKRAITRVVVYERYFLLHEACPGIGCAVSGLSESIKQLWGGSFVPQYLDKPPRLGALSTWIFGFIHVVVILLFLSLYYWG